MNAQKNHLLLGTRKGLAVYRRENTGWTFQKMYFLGIPVTLAYVDERTNTWWACLDHGHWGVKLHRSNDAGTNWQELPPPKYPEGEEIKDGVPATTKLIWAIAHGGKNKPDEIYLGTEPGGLFHSKNYGDQFTLNQSLWQHPSRKEHWFGGGRDHAGIHSIVVDPRDDDHVFIGISCAGVFETTDAGTTWTIRNEGLRADFLPDPHAEVGHDPHMLLTCAAQPDVMWQQNHCGIFRSEDGGKKWNDVSDHGKTAYFGFALAVDAVNSDRAWVVPSVSDEIRVTINESLCVCRTEDGGQSWQELRTGLPQNGCFDIVYRHALANNENELVFGTTCGNLFYSENGGDNWECLNHYLPMVHSVHFAK